MTEAHIVRVVAYRHRSGKLPVPGIEDLDLVTAPATDVQEFSVRGKQAGVSFGAQREALQFKWISQINDVQGIVFSGHRVQYFFCVIKRNAGRGDLFRPGAYPVPCDDPHRSAG